MKKIEVKIIKKWKVGDAQEVEEKQVSSKYVCKGEAGKTFEEMEVKNEDN